MRPGEGLSFNLNFIINHIRCSLVSSRTFCWAIFLNCHETCRLLDLCNCKLPLKQSCYLQKVIAISHNQLIPHFSVCHHSIERSNSRKQTIIAIACLLESLLVCLSYHKTSTESHTQTKLRNSNRIQIKGICSERFFLSPACSLLKCCTHFTWIVVAQCVSSTMIADFHGFVAENFKSLILLSLAPFH